MCTPEIRQAQKARAQLRTGVNVKGSGFLNEGTTRRVNVTGTQGGGGRENRNRNLPQGAMDRLGSLGIRSATRERDGEVSVPAFRGPDLSDKERVERLKVGKDFRLGIGRKGATRTSAAALKITTTTSSPGEPGEKGGTSRRRNSTKTIKVRDMKLLDDTKVKIKKGLAARKKQKKARRNKQN
jgi:hypothetical protein